MIERYPPQVETRVRVAVGVWTKIHRWWIFDSGGYLIQGLRVLWIPDIG